MSPRPRASCAPLLLLLCACSPEVTWIGAQLPDAAPRDAEAVDAAPEDAAPPPSEPGLYIEAEAGELSAGYTIGDDEAASGGYYLAPPAEFPACTEPGPARARYTLPIAEPGSYVLWGRVHTPDAVQNRFWFQLDDGPFYLWRISVGDIWYWDDFHDNRDYGTPLTFELDAGDHTLTIANCAPEAALDRLYVTADGDKPPGNDTPCDPPHTIEVAGECLPSCGLLAGTSCDPPICESREALPAYDCDVCCRVE